MKIYIDAGHGGDNPGATYKGRKESEDVFRLSESVKRLLEKQGVEVKASRGAHDDPELSARAAEANAWGADYFISIHRNAFEPNKAVGSEVWVYSKVETGGETYSKAKNINDTLCTAVGFVNRGIKKGAPSYADYGVNRLTNMSSCLLEVGFVDSDTDNEIFDTRFDDMVLTIAKGLMAAVGLKYAVPGDIDGDGKVTAEDARTALRAAVGLENLTAEQKKAADIDGDGKITSADAREILRESVGLEKQK